MKYVILTGDTEAQLMAKVAEHLAKGWRLQGGVSVAVTEDETCYAVLYAQAMVKGVY